jgi:hypothetical protein
MVTKGDDAASAGAGAMAGYFGGPYSGAAPGIGGADGADTGSGGLGTGAGGANDAAPFGGGGRVTLGSAGIANTAGSSTVTSIAGADGTGTGAGGAGTGAGGANGAARFGGGGRSTVGSAGAGTVTNVAGANGSGAAAGFGNSGIGGASTVSACPCSRRADSAIASACPRGADTSSTTSIGPDGGTATLQTQTGPFTAEIFPHSLANTTDVTLTELSAPPPDGFVDYSPIYEVAPTGVDLVNGGQIEIYTSNQLQWLDPALAIYSADSMDGPWTRLDDSSPNAGFLTATLLRTGYFFAGYPVSGDGCQSAPPTDGGNMTSCPCTRSPDATPSTWCPRGADVSVAANIGPAGGTVTLDGTPNTVGVPAQVQISPNSLPAPTAITLRELSAPPPSAFTDFSPIYELDPLGLALAQGSSIRLNEVNVANGMVSWNDLSIYTADSADGPWTKLDDQQPNAGFTTAAVVTTGFFFIGRPSSDDASCH